MIVSLLRSGQCPLQGSVWVTHQVQIHLISSRESLEGFLIRVSTRSRWREVEELKRPVEKGNSSPGEWARAVPSAPNVSARQKAPEQSSAQRQEELRSLCQVCVGCTLLGQQRGQKPLQKPWKMKRQEKGRGKVSSWNSFFLSDQHPLGLAWV